MNHFSSDFEDISLDLTPIIDTVFLLLIFFIMATTFSKPVLEVALAEAESASIQEKKPQELSLSITADGTFHLDEKPVTLEVWRALLDQASENAVVTFNVDKAAPFDSFMTALDAAKAKGKNTVVINAAKPDARP